MRTIADNIASVRERIASAAARCGLEGGRVGLVAVTKTRSTDEMDEAARYNVIALGENRVQEALSKWDPMASRSSIPWHLVGHLQKNKAKKAIEIFNCVQSVDSLELASVLDRACFAAGRRLDILLEVNIGEDPDKFGVSRDALEILAEGILQGCENLDLRGLMTVLPLGLDERGTRMLFASMRQLRDETESRLGLSLPVLSMGMSGDFEYAVMEGSTMVRIGSAIFGDRIY
ncbi:MAG TPA: YggS family pyridoxal phosphate-dependent enzyme [Synergistales bacterium]|nr:YggS family pyridoxal phosphate-dependent enzyme [Synergistales bacterium]HPC75387.1 YggS family pyridoxal phosphate-dependent enzyme [Synergistales bacterium]HRS48176.1 YggS family pyridoxal phosphate-dependent enzyme [Thermovirgaceae bacterium]HRU90630.1 YggS family pyridoxal phosphate-dependent enzyme [Thermovirgaceae bacterium]